MSPEPSTSSTAPQTRCGYPILRALSAGQSYVARGPGGRDLVLKRLDGDCLLRERLHPSVRDRLNRVREVAHRGVANFYGVEVDDDVPWLVWGFLPGFQFDDYLALPDRTPAEVRVLARELILAVNSLHTLGIVHGALVPGNVLVGPSGDVLLTHISPLLYQDTAVDRDSIIALLQHVLDRRGEADSPLAALLADAGESRLSLAAIASLLAADTRGATSDATPPAPSARSPRRRALVAAFIVSAAAIALGTGIWYAGGGFDGPRVPRPPAWMSPSP